MPPSHGPRFMLALAACLLLAASVTAAACSDNCLDGCPSPRALAACTAADPTLTVDALLADPTPHLDAVVSVRGTLAQEAAICTQLGCFDGCCNSCGARLALAGTAARLIPLASSTTDLTCGGDDSRVCCPLRTGTAVTVAARFQKESDTLDGPTFVLTDAAVCASSD